MNLRIVILASVFGFVAIESLFCSPGKIDPTFDAGSSVDGSVYEVAVQSDGKIIIGGYFNTVQGAVRRHIARLNTDGTSDGSFNPGGSADNSIDTIIIQPDGKVLIAGTFTNFDGVSRNGVARLHSDGRLDTTFDPGSGANSYVYGMVLQTDGKVLLVGAFSSINGTSRNGIARLNADGSLDDTFNPGTGANEYISSIVVQGDGKVLIAGPFTSINSINRNCVARLNADGTVDTTFSPAAISVVMDVYALALQQDGKVLIGGPFVVIDGNQFRYYIARLNADGSLDTSFDQGASGDPDILSIDEQPDGKILVGGRFTFVNGTSRNRIARLNANGTVDASFNPGTGANSSVVKVLLLEDGDVLVGGLFTEMGGTMRNRIARLNANGSLDTGFNPGKVVSDLIDCIALQADGRVVIGGTFKSVGGTNRNRIARLHADGKLDSTFNPGTGANSNVNSVVLQTDSRVLLTGNFTAINGTNRNRIARLNADGSLDATFNPGAGANNITYAVAVQPDGKVLVGGGFTTMNATNRNRIARLNSDGSLDASFTPGIGPDRDVLTIAVQADGKSLIGGSFRTVNGTNRDGIARLNEDGSLDGSFDPGTNHNSAAVAIAVQSDGKIVVGGIQTIFNGTNLNNILRRNTNGSTDLQFSPSKANGPVYSVVVRPDGKIYVGGFFTLINGASRNGIARLNADGSLDSSFNPGDGANDWVYSIAVQPDGKVLVSGAFSVLNATAAWKIGRLLGDSPLLNILRVNGYAVLSWQPPGYALQSAPFPTATFTNVPDATSPYTNSALQTQQYFRLKSN